MSKIKSLERLREVLADCVIKDTFAGQRDTYWITKDTADKLIDEIEDEIEEHYTLLPLDADGVPIRVRDELECHANGYDGAFTVFAIGNGVVVGDHDIEWIARNPNNWFHVASFCTHAKPRTLEDVLRDVWKEALDYAKSDMWRSPDEVFSERAAEIRELMEG